jgi:S1-C subfamily serine protease
LTGVQDDSRYFQISVPIQPGNSGGPLFDYKGGLIGITTASLNEDAVKTNVQNVNYAIKINLLQNIISLMPDNEQVKISSAEDGTEIPLSLLSEKYKPFIFKISTFK